MQHRQNITTGRPFETKIGFSRAVRVGNQVSVSGTLAADPNGELIAPGDAYKQTKAIIEIFESVLAEAGATLADVVRTRSYITDMSQWEGFAQAHGEAFATIQPAATLVEVSSLVVDGAVIEIEAEAVIGT